MDNPTKNGLYPRRGNKADFIDENAIEPGEIVISEDTKELGTQGGWMSFGGNRGQIGEIFKQSSADTLTFGTTWGDGKIWDTKTFSGKSRIRLDWRCPFRNNSSTWGGGYIDIQLSINGGTFYSVGHSGYDGGVMQYQYAAGSMSGYVMLTDMPDEDFTFQVKFRHRSYDGTVTINGSHDISAGTESAFFSNILLTEILG